MSYVFPGRRTQLTDLIVHRSAKLDKGATADWGPVQDNNILFDGDLHLNGNVYLSPNTVFHGNMVVQGSLTVSNLITALEDIYATNNLHVDGLASLAYLNVYNSAVISNLTVLSNLVSQYITVYDINATNNYFLNGTIFSGGGGGSVDWNNVPNMRMIAGASINMNGGTVYGASNVITGNLYVQNRSEFQNIIVTGYSNLYGNLFVQGQSDFQNIIIHGSSNLQGNLTASNLYVKYQSELQNLLVHGSSNLQGNLSASNLYIKYQSELQNLIVHGYTNLFGLTVQGPSDFQSILVHGASNLQGNVTASNLYVKYQSEFEKLIVNGTSNLQGNVTTSNLYVKYQSEFENLIVNGYTNLFGNLTVQGTQSEFQNIIVNGYSALYGNLSAPNITTGNLYVENQTEFENLIVRGYANMYGNVTMFQSLVVDINAYVSNLLYATDIQTTSITFEDGGITGGGGSGGCCDFITSVPQHNLAIGANCFSPSLNASGNLGFGDNSFPVLQTGSDNTTIGSDGMGYLTTGTMNTGIGHWSLNTINNGSFNTSVGGLTGPNIKSGSFNTSLGYNAGYNIASDGTNNIVIGANANLPNQVGSFDVYDTSGNSLLKVAGGSPTAITADSTGNVYVFESLSRTTSKYDSLGNHLMTFTFLNNINVFSLGVDSSFQLYATDGGTYDIYKILPDGTGSIFYAYSDYYYSFQIATDPTGNVYVPFEKGGVADSGALVKFDSSGSVIWESPGRSPAGVAIDSTGNVYATNSFTKNVTVHDPLTGSILKTFQYDYVPTTIGVDSLFQFYVIPYPPTVVYKYSPSGVLIQTFSELSGPNSLHLVNDTLYITSSTGGPTQ